jgi:hypothetical protein
VQPGSLVAQPPVPTSSPFGALRKTQPTQPVQPKKEEKVITKSTILIK